MEKDLQNEQVDKTHVENQRNDKYMYFVQNA
jgi:hypothetical protein